MNLGGLVCLIGAFAVTTVYKLVNGVGKQPFPNGFPALPLPPFGPEGEVVPDGPANADRNASMKALKAAGGTLAIFGSPFQALADIAPLKGFSWDVTAKGLLFPTINAICGPTMFQMVGSCPDVNGKPWLTGPWGPSFMVASLNAGLSWGTIVLYFTGFSNTGAFKNFREVKAGPLITAIAAGAALYCNYTGAAPNDYAKAQAAVSAVPGLSQLIRWGIRPADDVSIVQAVVGAAIDGLACATAGAMMAVPAYWPGPKITSESLPAGQVGHDYWTAVEHSGGDRIFNQPLTWSIDGALPDGLILQAGSGYISGKPTRAQDATFTVHVHDAYAPPQWASKQLTLRITA